MGHLLTGTSGCGFAIDMMDIGLVPVGVWMGAGLENGPVEDSTTKHTWTTMYPPGPN